MSFDIGCAWTMAIVFFKGMTMLTSDKQEDVQLAWHCIEENGN